MIENTSETETTIVTITLERKYKGPNCFFLANLTSIRSIRTKTKINVIKYQ